MQSSDIIVKNSPKDAGSFVRILVAEDNSPVRAAMRLVLESTNEHWQVIEAVDGAKAVEKAGKYRPDLIILDLKMPAMDGFEAARQIKKLLPGVPILMHTMFSSPTVDFEALAIGVRKVIAKSESNALISAVLEILHSGPAAQSA